MELCPSHYRGVNKGGAIAPPDIVRIKGATRQQWRAVLIHSFRKLLTPLHYFVLPASGMLPHENSGANTKLSTPFENPQRWMGQNTFPILLLNDDNMIGEH